MATQSATAEDLVPSSRPRLALVPPPDEAFDEATDVVVCGEPGSTAVITSAAPDEQTWVADCVEPPTTQWMRPLPPRMVVLSLRAQTAADDDARVCELLSAPETPSGMIVAPHIPSVTGALPIVSTAPTSPPAVVSAMAPPLAVSSPAAPARPSPTPTVSWETPLQQEPTLLTTLSTRRAHRIQLAVAFSSAFVAGLALAYGMFGAEANTSEDASRQGDGSQSARVSPVGPESNSVVQIPVPTANARPVVNTQPVNDSTRVDAPEPSPVTTPTRPVDRYRRLTIRTSPRDTRIRVNGRLLRRGKTSTHVRVGRSAKVVATRPGYQPRVLRVRMDDRPRSVRLRLRKRAGTWLNLLAKPSSSKRRQRTASMRRRTRR